VNADGQVVADAGGQATLAFPTDGQIATVNVNVGDHVSQGEVLASLDSRLASSGIGQAQADVTTAQANLARAAAGARPQEIAQTSALIQGAEAKAAAAKAEFDRQQALARVGISSQRDLQQARSDYENALADLHSKQQQSSLLKAGPRAQDVQVARAQLAQAQAELSTAQTKSSLLNIVAPFDGIVTQRLRNPGETVDPSTPVIGLVNPSRTLVEVQLSQDQAALVSRGDVAAISVSGATRRLPAKVVAVSPALGLETRTMTVRIRPESGNLTPGATAKAAIVVQSLRNALVVPDSAVVKDPETGNPVIFIAKSNGKYQRIPVQIQLHAGSRMAIAATGLTPGQRVVTEGAYELLQFPGTTPSD